MNFIQSVRSIGVLDIAVRAVLAAIAGLFLILATDTAPASAATTAVAAFALSLVFEVCWRYLRRQAGVRTQFK